MRCSVAVPICLQAERYIADRALVRTLMALLVAADRLCVSYFIQVLERLEVSLIVHSHCESLRAAPAAGKLFGRHGALRLT
jgi:hypothetical protein